LSNASRNRIQQLLNLNRVTEARDLAKSSLAEDPEDPALLSLLADAEYLLDGPGVALPIVEQALSIEPKRAAFHAQRGHFLSHHGRHEAAEEGFLRALAIDPTHQFALTARVEAILRDPRTGRRKHKEERLRAARSSADALLSTYPNAAVSHLTDAKVKLANEDFIGCEAAATEGLRISPENPIGHQLIGFAAEGQGKTREAGDAFVRAQRADPTSTTGLEGLRRLGKGAAAPLGFGAFLVFRLISRTGRIAGGAIAAVLVIAVVIGLIYYVVQRSERQKTTAKQTLSPEAQAILDQDDRFS